MAIPATRYKKPSRINAVSISLLLVLAALGYVAHSIWPVLSLRAKVKGELQDALPQLYRWNLRPEAQARPEIIRLRQVLTARLATIGVKDKKLELVIKRDKQLVSIEARFSADATFPVLEKTMRFDLAPKVQTDAARVEW